MNLLAWNCRGCGGSSTIRNLKNILRSAAVKMALILETKCGAGKSQSIIQSLPITNSFVVPSSGLSGGLWLIWDDSVKVIILSSSNN